MKGAIEKLWYQPSIIQWLFWPVHLLFRALVSLRCTQYSLGLKKTTKPNTKVIIVGNITVGGTGKTPFIIWLVEYLAHRGKSVAIISRGYGGKSSRYPLEVSTATAADEAGDEPKLLAERLKVPVVVDPNRVRAALHAENKFHPDFIISDDGLQHYALGRDFEICIIDGLRKLGNRFLMPVGPLREPKSRLASCDLVLQNGGDDWLSTRFDIQPLHWVNLHGGETIDVADETLPFDNCTAVCGIGNPEKFSKTLQQLSLKFDLRVFPDHHQYNEADFEEFNDSPVVMTEKDAIKCQAFAKQNWWYLKVGVKPNAKAISAIEHMIKGS